MQLLSKWNSSTLQHTLTREAIACESHIASTVIATLCVTAGCITMAYVFSQCTLIDIYRMITRQLHWV